MYDKTTTYNPSLSLLEKLLVFHALRKRLSITTKITWES